MDKQIADSIISEYLPKIFGFAVKKSFSYDEAEELSSDMVEAVYTSLSKSGEIYNVEGYIWRICEHTYAKFVSHKKQRAGISLDGLQIADIPDDEEDNGEKIDKLRIEIAYLSRIRREIVYSFYYERKSISEISRERNIPEGTVKWHLNKARNDLKEGFNMERKIGRLGLNPVKYNGIGHNGNPGRGRGPEDYISDLLNLNIVYSVYHTPRTREEIADELGVTPVYIDDRINFLEANGYLVKQSKDKYTTYVRFTPETYSLERQDILTKKRLEIAKELAEKYAPQIISAVADVKDIYIPSGNKALLEMSAIMYAVNNNCRINIKPTVDNSKYFIKDTKGGNYQAFVNLERKRIDPEYKTDLERIDYWACGDMTRWSEKYTVESWSIDSRYSLREGYWANNYTSDYEYLYEYMIGTISDTKENSEKMARLRKRKYITDDGKVNIVVVRQKMKEFFAMLPKPQPEIIDRIAKFAVEQANMDAKEYPPQMQDLVIFNHTCYFIDASVALMVLDILTENGTLAPLSEQDKVSANLIMFSDILPKY